MFVFVSNAGTQEVARYDCSNSYAEKVYCLTNSYRKDNGLSQLEYSEELIEVSKQKSDHMCENNYFSHDYEDRNWTYYIENNSIKYEKAGENLARYFNDPSDAMKALVASPTHKDNLLGDYTHLGVYTASCNGINYTTQTFAKMAY